MKEDEEPTKPQYNMVKDKNLPENKISWRNSSKDQKTEKM